MKHVSVAEPIRSRVAAILSDLTADPNPTLALGEAVMRSYLQQFGEIAVWASRERQCFSVGPVMVELDDRALFYLGQVGYPRCVEELDRTHIAQEIAEAQTGTRHTFILEAV